MFGEREFVSYDNSCWNRISVSLENIGDLDGLVLLLSGGGSFLMVALNTPFSQHAEMPLASASSGSQNLHTNDRGKALTCSSRPPQSSSP